MQYWAFISYSHRDRSWGRWLHHSLETYCIPRQLIGTDGRDGPIPRRLIPVFRDREELPSASDLGTTIGDALAKSRYLIVICSPRSAQSKWVNEEILNFKRMGRQERVLCLIVDGEPHASDQPETKDLECFPEALRYEVDAETGELTDRMAEPIAADARPGKDGRADAKLKLLAGLLGVKYDMLKQRELIRRQRRLVNIAIATTTVMVMMIGLAIFALLAKQEADRQTVFAKEQKGVADEQRLLAVERERSTRQRYYASSVKVVDEAWSQANLQQVNQLLDAHLPKPHESDDLRGFEWHLFDRWRQRPVYTVENLPQVQLEHFAVSPDGKLIATLLSPVDETGTRSEAEDARSPLVLIDASTGKIAQLSSTEIDDLDVRAPVVFSRDSHRVYTVLDGHEVTAFTTEPYEVERVLIRTESEVTHLAITTDERLVIAEESGHITLISTTEPEVEPTRWAAGLGEISELRVLPETGRLMVADYSEVTHWDIGFSPPTQVSKESGFLLQAIAPDGSFGIASVKEDKKLVRIWRPGVKTEELITLPHELSVMDAAIAHDGSLIATCSLDRRVNLWDPETGSKIAELRGHLMGVVSVGFLPGNQIVFSRGFDKTLRAWKTGGDHKDGITLKTGYRGASSVAWSADGSVLFASDRSAVVSYSVPSLEVKGRKSVGASGIEWIARSDDGRLLATADKSGWVKVWTLPEMKQLWAWRDVRQPIWEVAFSHDHSLIAYAYTEGVTLVRDLESGEIIRRIDPGENAGSVYRSLVFTGNGHLAMCLNPLEDVSIVDVHTGGTVKTLSNPRQHIGMHLAVSPNGRWLAGAFGVASLSGELYVWDLKTGALVHELTGHEGAVRRVAFSPDSRTLASGGWEDKTVRLWHVETGQQMAALRGHDWWLYGLAFSPDGRTLASCSDYDVDWFPEPPESSPQSMILWSGAELNREGTAVVARPIPYNAYESGIRRIEDLRSFIVENIDDPKFDKQVLETVVVYLSIVQYQLPPQTLQLIEKHASDLIEFNPEDLWERVRHVGQLAGVGQYLHKKERFHLSLKILERASEQANAAATDPDLDQAQSESLVESFTEISYLLCQLHTTNYEDPQFESLEDIHAGLDRLADLARAVDLNHVHFLDAMLKLHLMAEDVHGLLAYCEIAESSPLASKLGKQIQELRQRVEKALKEEPLYRAPDVDFLRKAGVYYFQLGVRAYDKDQYEDAQKLMSMAEAEFTQVINNSEQPLEDSLNLARATRYRVNSMANQKPDSTILLKEFNTLILRWKEVLEIEPDNFEALYRIALTYRAMAYHSSEDGAFDKALEHAAQSVEYFEKTFETDPTGINAENIARQAMNQLQILIEISPEPDNLKVERTRLEEKAVKYLEKAVELGEEQPSRWKEDSVFEMLKHRPDFQKVIQGSKS